MSDITHINVVTLFIAAVVFGAGWTIGAMAVELVRGLFK